jgi:hypothetical protein
MTRQGGPGEPMDDVLLIAGSRNPVLADYAAHRANRSRSRETSASSTNRSLTTSATARARAGRPVVVIAAASLGTQLRTHVEFHPSQSFTAHAMRAAHPGRRYGSVVLFLDAALTRRDRAVFQAVVELARAGGAGCVCVVSTFRVHLGDRAAARAEAELLGLLRDLPARVVVVRPGHVLSRHSRLCVFVRASSYLVPFVSPRLRACCVDAGELFAVIDRELDATGPRRRTFTLLGESKPWQDLLREQQKGFLARAYATLMAGLIPLTVFRSILGLLVRAVAPKTPRLRPWHLETLRPGSVQELLALYNPYNYRHVKVVGYNNGVVHFGHRHAGKTVVSTVACGRRARVRGDVAEFDAGVTIRRALDVLGPAGRELHVLPNYSYVSLGTSYFVPIHGSSSKFSTIGDTIEKVVLYDPVADRLVTAERQDPAFGAGMYNLAADLLLLRLRLKTAAKSRYYAKELRLTNPSSAAILGYFHDTRPSNVEVRKAGSATDTVHVYQYFTAAAEGEGALEVPRDAIGRVWDRLEENPVASPLFHALTRWLAYHVELFLSEAEFATFWETHAAQPIMKIQLRSIRRDGLPHSPFRDHDCVSADLFMHKKHRPTFDAYLKQTLPGVKMNPGKHSM